MKFISVLLNAVLPPRCPFTGEIVDSSGMISADAWKCLSFISLPCCRACGVPFEINPGSSDALCPSCLVSPPRYNRARAAIVYDDASRDFVLGFKHGDKTESVAAMVPWLKTAGIELLRDADMLVPVPLHRLRLLKRRYNQAALMAFALTKATGIPTLPDMLLRPRSTPPQGHLSIAERAKNVRRAFTVHPRMNDRIAGKRILLIDDVYTTGATVNECAKILVDAGALGVDVLTLARVVRPARF